MKKILVIILGLLLCFVLAACNSRDDEDIEENPDEFSYEMLDLSIMVGDLYRSLDITKLTANSVSVITDETVLTEQYYLNLDDLISYEVRCADGKYGVADIIVLRVKEGKAEAAMEALEKRKDDRINEFLNYDVYNSYNIAVDAEIYQVGELVVMLMLSEDDKETVKELIDGYIPQ